MKDPDTGIPERFARCLMPGAARRLVSFFCLPKKKGTKENGTPFRRPCVARQAGRLRNSADGLRQSSPTSPGLAALLGDGKGEASKTQFKTVLLVRAKPGQSKTKQHAQRA
ncbi:MAG: hypothetical protein ACYCZH_01540 [Sulfuriferula sp.]